MNTLNNCVEQESFLPQKDREYLAEKGFKYREVIEGKVKCLIIEEYSLPEGKYNVETVNLLVKIPNGYNDTPPDMFFCYPHLKFSNTNVDPPATGGRFSFDEKSWQQWSRHSNVGNDWRPGIDGISSHLQKVNAALKKG
ncbi:E2/UBC family protein [Flagellimonas aequoris]|uniref:UBC core domain-containing protein n=1 Tax=Flagellimonas aequoris TaxID=2306997 RepID=A0A418N4F0_9FLAO|nr:E2/UBC family protein [Allomuricauda aequoris]RIV68686.1 hypothetical protein D2U88_15975 [Allomuricauda aequoris]TXK00385.1 hypothetical protein FQ019_15800 [Allomuricauda aequoris]